MIDREIPIVFAGVNWDASVYGYPTSNITGMVEIDLISQLVSHLNKLSTGNRVGVIFDDTTTGRKTAQVYQQRFFDGELDVYYASNFAEFKDAFLQAQTEMDSLIVHNNAGIQDWDPAPAEAFMLENTRIPTGSVYSWMTPYVVVVVAGQAFEQGEWAGQTALTILGGTSPENIPLVQNKRGDLILNFELAQQLNLVFPPELLRNATFDTP